MVLLVKPEVHCCLYFFIPNKDKYLNKFEDILAANHEIRWLALLSSIPVFSMTD